MLREFFEWPKMFRTASMSPSVATYSWSALDLRQECHPINSGDGRFPAFAKSCSTSSMESYEIWHSLLKDLNMKSVGVPLWYEVKTRRRLIPSLGFLWSAKYIRDFAPSEKVSFFPSAIHIVTCSGLKDHIRSQ